MHKQSKYVNNDNMLRLELKGKTRQLSSNKEAMSIDDKFSQNQHYVHYHANPPKNIYRGDNKQSKIKKFTL